MNTSSATGLGPALKTGSAPQSASPDRAGSNDTRFRDMLADQQVKGANRDRGKPQQSAQTKPDNTPADTDAAKKTRTTTQNEKHPETTNKTADARHGSHKKQPTSEAGKKPDHPAHKSVVKKDKPTGPSLIAADLNIHPDIQAHAKANATAGTGHGDSRTHSADRRTTARHHSDQKTSKKTSQDTDQNRTDPTATAKSNDGRDDAAARVRGAIHEINARAHGRRAGRAHDAATSRSDRQTAQQADRAHEIDAAAQGRSALAADARLQSNWTATTLDRVQAHADKSAKNLASQVNAKAILAQSTQAQAVLHGLGPTHTTPAANVMPTPTTMTGVIQAAPGTEQWNQAITQQSLRLAGRAGGQAELTLHPPSLGQLHISMQLGHHAQMQFASPHADVRAAIQSALPQLKEAFADAGLSLGQTSVGDQSPQQSQSNDSGDDRRRPGVVGMDPHPDESTGGAVHITRIAGRTLNGRIDIFA